MCRRGRKEEGDRHPWPGVIGRGLTREHENTGADDPADAQAISETQPSARLRPSPSAAPFSAMISWMDFREK